MGEVKKFAFYKHLVGMECRKDIILQNDFINTKTRGKNISFLFKYKDKITKNKMRIAYLLGFSFILNLGFLYDTFFDSHLYRSFTSRFDKFIQMSDYQRQFSRINYNSKQAQSLGNYFLRLQSININKQVTPTLLSSRIPAFADITNNQFDVNTFVQFCLQHNISIEELPEPTTFR